MEFKAPIGTVKLLLGSMFAGKTEELIRIRSIYIRAEQPTLLIKYRGDTRYSPKDVVSHDKKTAPSDVVTDKLVSIPEDVWKAKKAILIDEGQFFPDLAAFVEKVRNTQTCDIIIGALNGTSDQLPWPSISALIPMEVTIQHMKAVCMGCPYKGRDVANASYTVLKTDSTPKKGVIHIGGADMYKAVCGECLRDLKTKTKG